MSPARKNHPRKTALRAAISVALLSGYAACHAQAVVSLSPLDPPRGVVFRGTGPFDYAGTDVALVGDFNGDGFDDLAVGDPGPDARVYLIFGSAEPESSFLQLAATGVAITGDGFGIGDVVAPAGDFNGDGFDDLLITAVSDNRAFVLFGTDQALPAALSISGLTGSNGFSISGNSAGFGGAGVGAGDINGDGFDDLLVSAPRELVRRRIVTVVNEYPQAGKVYALFGTDQPPAPIVAVDALDGSNGMVLLGESENGYVGISLAAAGDFNGDGFDDLIVGSGDERAYLVFGRGQFGIAGQRLSDLDATTGFLVAGGQAGTGLGINVAGSDDLNGDGLADIAVAAPGADGGGSSRGEVYVVFGSEETADASLDVTGLVGSNGFTVAGKENFHGLRGVASAGDVNGDGVDDLLLGARGAGSQLLSETGETYVLFGSRAGFSPQPSLAALNGQNGIAIPGVDEFTYTGDVIDGGADFNGDGVADIVIGSSVTPLAGDSFVGAAYLVLGNSAPTAAYAIRPVGGGTAGSQLPQLAVADLASLTLDPDGLAGIAVVEHAQFPQQGQWQFDAGGGWTALSGTVSDANALVLNGDAFLRFQPATGFLGEAEPLTIRLWDGYLSQAGEGVNIVGAIGGFGGFSNDENQVRLVAQVSDVLFSDGFE